MQDFKWQEQLDGDNYRSWRRPCIYAWYRKFKCLYVGQSKNGIVRPFGDHQIIGVVECVQLGDTFKFFYPEMVANDTLDFWEVRLIKQLKPFYNTIHNNTKPYEKRADSDLSKLPKAVSNQEKLAEILQTTVSDYLLLEDPCDCANTNAKLTISELEEKSRRLQQAQRIFKQLKTNEPYTGRR